MTSPAYKTIPIGSAAYLTSGGDVTQTLNYLPYGEDWIDVQNNMDPRLGQYRFNGKEKDYESGFHYYGARYYWNEVLTGWLSVDPMMDKYPNISPYAYCAWNPIKLVDPDGREIGDFYGADGRYLGNDGKKDGKVYVIRNGEDALCGTWDLFTSKCKVLLHSGNSEYFDNHSEIYDNFISILPLDMLAEAYAAIQDDGTGGAIDANNREYGGYANEKGDAWERLDIISDIGNPQEGDIPIPGLNNSRIRFHSHPSGTRSTGKQYAVDPWKTTFTEGKIGETHSWVQTPSTADIKRAGNKINYVFGMGDKTLSVYDNMGTQATIRLKGSDLGAKLGVK